MPSHVEEMRWVEERADGCHEEETFVYKDSETDNEVENIVKDALGNDKIVALGPVICSS